MDHYDPRDLLPRSLRVARAQGDLLFTEDGRQLIDLLGGSGSVFLGHANPAVARPIQAQLDTLWNTGAVPTRPWIEAREAVNSWFPPSHELAILYSTGMEAAEFALRLARRVTGRKGAVGFDGSMHGKSMATAALAWRDDLVHVPEFHRVPYLPRVSEDETLQNLQRVLAHDDISAVFLEPLLGSSGGHIPTRRFADRLSELCADHGCLLVVDEILTGFHRTGTAFLHRHLGMTPDIVLIGKAMGNGFPVSGVVVDSRHRVEPAMLPGSTFAENPLACVAVSATLGEMRSRNLTEMVGAIERIMCDRLASLPEAGIALRGKGALWILEFPDASRMPDVVGRILDGGVMVSATSRFIRLLPAATISSDHLSRACDVVRDACAASFGAR